MDSHTVVNCIPKVTSYVSSNPPTVVHGRTDYDGIVARKVSPRFPGVISDE